MSTYTCMPILLHHCLFITASKLTSNFGYNIVLLPSILISDITGIVWYFILLVPDQVNFYQ